MKQTILAIGLVLVAATANATPFQITLDTSPLTGVQTLGFGLTNFDSSSNEVTLSEFDFWGGTAIGGSVDCTLGGTFSGAGCSGDFAVGITLADLDQTAAFFTQQFNPGSSLSFVLNTSNDFSGGGIPDQFAVFVCDGPLTTCYSDDASAAMLLLDLAGGTLSVSSFSTFGASLQGLSAPVVTESVPPPPGTGVPVPEPGTLVLFGSGLMAVLRRKYLESGVSRTIGRRRESA